MLFLVRRSDFVCAKEKAIWATIDHVRANPKTLWGGNDVFGYFVPRDVKIDVFMAGSLSIASSIAACPLIG